MLEYWGVRENEGYQIPHMLGTKGRGTPVDMSHMIVADEADKGTNWRSKEDVESEG